MTPRNARFLVLDRTADNWIKITLRPGQSLARHWGGPDDEGWSRGADTWTHAGDRVVLHHWSEGADCDGRVSEEWTDECPLLFLAAVPCYPDETLRRPDWRAVSRESRDYAAEAAGY